MAIEEDAAHGAASIIPADMEEARGHIFSRGLKVSQPEMHHDNVRVRCGRLSHGKSGGNRRSSFFVCQ